jgi:predicted amidohydrolase YtcJ
VRRSSSRAGGAERPLCGLDRREFLKLGAASGLALATGGRAFGEEEAPDLVLFGGRIATLDPARPVVEALALRGDRVLAGGSSRELMARRGPATRTIDLAGRTLIPGLNDSHTHPIRGGLNYNLELRWEGLGSLGEALERLRIQARRTPPPQWVRVVGGWTEFQFAEGRMPTLDELNAAAPETPVFVLHLYDRALLNRAALRALGWQEDAPGFDRGLVQRDAKGRPTGLLIAQPSALILYSTLARGPKLSPDDQANSSRQFFRELNRLGVTSALDAGGGGQRYPDDYAVVKDLARRGLLTVRLGCDLFAQTPGEELADYRRWTELTHPGDGDDWLRTVGAGENLTWAAADFENFLEPRPELAETLEAQLEPIVRLLAEKRWPFRIHATYDESIARFLAVFERVDAAVPLGGLHWFVDHAETISDANIERVRALGGGIAIQHRMAFQGEAFVGRYGEPAAERTPPIRRMLELGVPVGAGTDATRVASYDPWICLHWLVTGRSLGGMQLYPETNRLSREEALRLWTRGSAWFSSEEDRKGALVPGQLADLAVLSKDYFSVPDDEIRGIESLLTIVGGRVVHAAGEFAALAPPPPPVSPGWSPAAHFGGAARVGAGPRRSAHPHAGCAHGTARPLGRAGLGCGCALA